MLTDCQGAQPEECPQANVPKNGGLACVTVANRRYCKPLCNYVSKALQQINALKRWTTFQ